MLTRISPALAVANWVTTHSALFGDQMPMRSPGSRPSASSPAANASTRSLQLAIAPADVLVADDQRIALAKALRRCGRNARRSSRRSAASRSPRGHSSTWSSHLPSPSPPPDPAALCSSRPKVSTGRPLPRQEGSAEDQRQGADAGTTVSSSVGCSWKRCGSYSAIATVRLLLPMGTGNAGKLVLAE